MSEENTSGKKVTEEETNSTLGTEPVTIPSSSAEREQTTTSTSEDADTPNSPGASGGTTKRQRTVSASSPLLVSASPPGFISLEEIMKAANSVSKMSLAHEIAVDEDFHLEKVEPPSNSIHQKIKEVAHQAFWDVLKEELEQDPPEYHRALSLFEEIREWLLSLLLPHQTKTQQEIRDKLDLDVIKQQIESDTFDMHSYSQYIISLMARLCSPVRDEKIRELTGLRDLIPLYKGIFETLELMKIDMANFTIRMVRPQIAACSVEYERAKFDDYLKVTPDGLRNTRSWLCRNEKSGPESTASSSTNDAPRIVSRIVVDSFIELLKWDDKNPWPETVAMDEQRFADLRNKLAVVELVSSVILVTLSCEGAGRLQSDMEFRSTLKAHITAIVEGSPNLKEEAEKLMPNVAVQVVEDVSKALAGQNASAGQLSEDTRQLITGQILELGKCDSRVRQIINSRLMEFLRQVISNEVARPTQIPAGLSLFKSEIAGIAGRFARLVSHNRAVFAQHYADLIQKHCIAP